jgi:hypothetical protein
MVIRFFFFFFFFIKKTEETEEIDKVFKETQICGGHARNCVTCLMMDVNGTLHRVSIKVAHSLLYELAGQNALQYKNNCTS